MKDFYIEGKSTSALDEEISQFLKDVAEAEMGGMPMVTAIQNETGEVYRVITVDGIGGYLSLVGKVASLGLVDIHAENLNPGKYDSLFVFKN